MFYVGDELWFEEGEYFNDIPGFQKFSGCARYPNGTKLWYEKGLRQSFQDPVTGEWMPAMVRPDGRKYWYEKGLRQSFQDSKTGEWMPAVVWSDGSKFWYDKGEFAGNPETYPWEEKREKANVYGW